jgi:hypothetical protein
MSDAEVLVDDLVIGLRVVERCQLGGEFVKPHGKILNGLAVMEREQLVLSPHLLQGCLGNSVIADAHHLDAVPCVLRRGLDGKRGDHVGWHSTSDHIEHRAVHLELGVSLVNHPPQRSRLQLDLHEERPLIVVCLRQDGLVHRPRWHDPLHQPLDDTLTTGACSSRPARARMPSALINR